MLFRSFDSYTPLPTDPYPEELISFFEGKPVLDERKLRSQIESCRACGPHVQPAPRFGLGNTQRPWLMIVGQNPPSEPGRCLHGGWMLHYQSPEWEAKKGSHEKLLSRLLQHLDVPLSNCYVTQSVKCPTEENAVPHFYGCAQQCAGRFLLYELEYIQPHLVLTFGYQAGRVVADCFGALTRRCDLQHSNFPCRSYGDYKFKQAVMGYAQVVEAPHPSLVNRFIYEKEWMDGIKAALNQANGADRLSTVATQANGVK